MDAVTHPNSESCSHNPCTECCRLQMCLGSTHRPNDGKLSNRFPNGGCLQVGYSTCQGAPAIWTPRYGKDSHCSTNWENAEWTWTQGRVGLIDCLLNQITLKKFVLSYCFCHLRDSLSWALVFLASCCQCSLTDNIQGISISRTQKANQQWNAGCKWAWGSQQVCGRDWEKCSRPFCRCWKGSEGSGWVIFQPPFL